MRDSVQLLGLTHAIEKRAKSARGMFPITPEEFAQMSKERGWDKLPEKESDFALNPIVRDVGSRIYDASHAFQTQVTKQMLGENPFISFLRTQLLHRYVGDNWKALGYREKPTLVQLPTKDEFDYFFSPNSTADERALMADANPYFILRSLPESARGYLKGTDSKDMASLVQAHPALTAINLNWLPQEGMLVPVGYNPMLAYGFAAHEYSHPLEYMESLKRYGEPEGVHFANYAFGGALPTGNRYAQEHVTSLRGGKLLYDAMKSGYFKVRDGERGVIPWLKRKINSALELTPEEAQRMTSMGLGTYAPTVQLTSLLQNANDRDAVENAVKRRQRGEGDSWGEGEVAGQVKAWEDAVNGYNALMQYRGAVRDRAAAARKRGVKLNIPRTQGGNVRGNFDLPDPYKQGETWDRAYPMEDKRRMYKAPETWQEAEQMGEPPYIGR